MNTPNWSGWQDQQPESPTTQERKKLRFNELVRVVLIPARTEYDQKTFNSVWFTSNDLESFRRNAFSDFLRHGRRDFGDFDDEAVSNQQSDKALHALGGPGVGSDGGYRVPVLLPSA